MSKAKNKAWLLFATGITIHIIIAATSSHDRRNVDLSGSKSRIIKRSDDHATHNSLFALPYAHWYEVAPEPAKPFIVIAILCVLGFLFSFIGITASDFFCPNLSTIASYLGLSESTAGVTFLAFGNGSPDVFSTFAALKGGTFGLAVGELIGAASFIVSIVVGSIAFVGPFHVPRQAFLRDVIFFTAAVVLLIAVLHDGRLSLLESGGMVLLYVLYVAVVIIGNWLHRRRRQKETYSALGFSDQETGAPQGGRGSPLPRLVIPEPVIRSADQSENQGEPSPRPISLHESPNHQSPSTSPAIRARFGRHTSSNLPHYLTPIEDEREMDTPRANFSLLGAVEFRDVVNNLRRESSSRDGSPIRSPYSGNESGDYFGPSALTHRRSSSIGVPKVTRKHTHKSRQRAASHIGGGIPPIASSSSSNHTPLHTPLPSEPNPWSDQVGNAPQHPSPSQPTSGTGSAKQGSRKSSHRSGIPSISIVNPAGVEGPPPTISTAPISTMPSQSRFQIRRKIRTILRILFPSMQSFRHKSFLGMFLAIVSVPPILALTLTLPVVDDGARDEGQIALPAGDTDPLDGNEENDDDRVSRHSSSSADSRLLNPEIGEELHHLVDNGFSPLHSPLGRISHAHLRRISEGSKVDDDAWNGIDAEDLVEYACESDNGYEEDTLDYHSGLTAVQCVLGPIWTIFITLRTVRFLEYMVLGAAIIGLVGAVAVLYNGGDGTSPTWRLVRCFAGFICAMVWIAAIADEVVGVLKAVGEILGLSDAIIGLTIFAVGNSLADLVANITVAQFAPAMAYAACFGGPMLNLLLGVGGSGTYHMLTHPGKTVKINFSPTLWVSASGLVIVLVATAFFVPLNGYRIDRRWASCLIVCYVVLMVVNVLVEVKTGRD